MRDHLRLFTFAAVCLVFVSVAAPAEADLLDGASDLTGGWRWLEWFGHFNDANLPWIYHLQHGWLYVSEGDATSAWMWSPGLRWFYISVDLYPSVYSTRFRDWFYCAPDTRSPCWFYDYAACDWVTFWIGERIAFTVNSQASQVGRFEVSYSGMSYGTYCSSPYFALHEFARPFAVNDGIFGYHHMSDQGLDIVGEFTSDTTASVSVSWSRHHDLCDADYSGSDSYTATRH
ncbi:hypothetical protein ACFLSJ_04065 [Verrucomicrobiota bacterium]